MFSSRHVLAIVCGLGMGVMASLFLLTNILADYSDDGVVGLPSEIYGNGVNLKIICLKISILTMLLFDIDLINL